MTDKEQSPFIKAVTAEGALFTWRTYMAGAAAIITAFTYDIKSGTSELKKELTEYRLLQESRISKIEGEMGQMRGTISTHRDRLSGNDADIRALWGRVFELRPQNPPATGGPR